MKFHGVVSVPPEMVRPSFRGRTDKPSTSRQPEALDEPDGIRKNGVLDVTDDMPVSDVKDFQYLVGTRHVDDEDGLTYQTTRVVVEGEWLVAYRRLVLKDGTVFQRTEDGPIFVRDIAHVTGCVGVGRAE